MIRGSGTKGEEALHTVVVVAFDGTTGEVYGTHVHGSLDRPDTAGLMRGRDRLLQEIAARSGESNAAVELLELPLEEVPPTGIARVDPQTRRFDAVANATKSLSQVDRP